MYNIIRAEHLKLRRTFGRKLPVIAPLITLFLTFLLLAGIEKAIPAGAWNWWYTILLPGMLAISSHLSMAKDKKCGYFHMKSLSLSGRRLVLGKICYLALGLLFSNVLVFLGTTIGGMIFGTTISISQALSAAFLLTIAFLWEIPWCLFFSARFGMFASLMVSMVFAISGVVILADTPVWWLSPAAIPARLMCPVLGIFPNGLMISAGSELLSCEVIIPGAALSVVWLVVSAVLFIHWFEKMEVK